METFDTSYWIWEYLKVLFGYFLIMLIWPHVVFYRHLKPKSPIYRFGFCMSVQTVLINTVVLGLGLLHILNDWTMYAVFYGIPLGLIYKRLRNLKIDSASLFHIVRISRLKMLLRRAFLFCSQKFKAFWQVIRPHFPEYLILGGIWLYSLLYFVWGPFQTLCYSFSDQYVHHSWIYGLIEGRIFSAGVYPEAMHCLIYSIHTLLGVDVHSLMLFFGSIQTSFFVIASYCLLRELFHWRYTPLVAVMMFSLFDVEGEAAIIGMSRLQGTLPLEFAALHQLLCVLFLLRYLKSDKKPPDTGKFSHFMIDDDLFLLVMSIAATVASHFHPAIVAVFLCLMTLFLYPRKIFSKERFLPLVASVLAGLLIAAAPMVAAWATGTPLQGSLNWGLNIIKGTTDDDNVSETSEDEKDDVDSGEVNQYDIYDIVKLIRNQYLYNGHPGFGNLFFELAVYIIAGFYVLKLIVLFCPSRIRDYLMAHDVDYDWSNGYIMLALLSFPIIFMTVAPAIGLPLLVPGDRIAVTEHIFLFALLFVPLDILFSLLRRWLRAPMQLVISLLCVVCVFAWCTREENYHGYLYCALTRYRTDTLILDSINKNFPRFKYTIVAPTDSIYHVIDHGRHEELLLFLEQASTGRYYLPTDYVFIFVEKNPLKYDQNHFASGPSWLALEKYSFGAASSQNPDVQHSKISREAAQKPVVRRQNPFHNYSFLAPRTILESRAYYWCQRFAELYPHEMSVYYEDDDFICYYFKQETHSPYNLSIDYEPK